jgi:hypothetical protein
MSGFEHRQSQACLVSYPTQFDKTHNSTWEHLQHAKLMASANLHFPRQSDTRIWPSLTIRTFDLILLALAVAICCAASVFAVLCQTDPDYPVSAIRDQISSPGPAPAAQASPAQTASEAPTVRVLESQPTRLTARTHEELLSLERLGVRNYTEFSITRSDTFQPVGPIRLGFLRTEPKHESMSASVIIGQRRFDLRHVHLNERVLIPLDNSEHLELVINRLTKNQVAGYVSEPKHDRWQIARVVQSALH